jgi:hypothetical protein
MAILIILAQSGMPDTTTGIDDTDWLGIFLCLLYLGFAIFRGIITGK